MRAYKCDLSGKYYDEPVQHEKVNLISYFYDEEKESYEEDPKDYDVHPQVQQLILDVLIKELPWEQKLQQLKINIELLQHDEEQKGPGLQLTIPAREETREELSDLEVQKDCSKTLYPIPEHIRWERQNDKYVFFHELSDTPYSSAFGANTAYNNMKKYQQRKEEREQRQQYIAEIREEKKQPAAKHSFIDMNSYPDVHRVTVDGKTVYKNDYVERTYNDPKYAQMAATRYKNQGGVLMSTYVKEEEDEEEKQTSWTNKRKDFLIKNYDMPEYLATRQANHEWRNGDHDAEQPPKEIMALPDCSRDEEADNKKNDFINSRVEQYLKQPGVSKNDAKQWAENEYKEIYG